MSRSFSVTWLVTFAMIVLWDASTCAAQIPEHYDLFILHPFRDKISGETYAWDANNGAQVCGTTTLKGSYVGFVRRSADDTREYAASFLRGINNAGKVAGHNLLIDTATGVQTVIPQLSDYYYIVWAEDVNDKDVVVGYAAWRNNEEGLNAAAFVWDAVNGTRGTAVPGLTALVAINNSNIAVGNVQYSTGSSEALVYKIDTEQAINLDDILTPVLGSPGYSEAHAVNNNGIVAGEGWNGEFYAAFTWSESGGFEFLPALGGGDRDRVHPYGISDDNLVVGYALTATNGWRAFAWDTNSGIRDLNDHVIGGDAFVCSRALGISNNGVIIGDGGFLIDGYIRGIYAFMLVPRYFTVTGVGDTPRAVSPEITAYPNPFNPQTAISYTVPSSGPVRLDIYRVTGEFVTNLVNGTVSAGTYTTSWSSQDAAGRTVSSGVYLVRLATPGASVTHKVVLLK